jgi:hypothetical protein
MYMQNNILHCLKINHNPESKHKVDCRVTLTPDKRKGRIRRRVEQASSTERPQQICTPSRNQAHEIIRRQSQYGKDREQNKALSRQASDNLQSQTRT